MIWFNQNRKDKVQAYLKTGEAKQYSEALQKVNEIIDGFQSPLGMELLASVDWLLRKSGCEPELEAVKEGLRNWPGGERAAGRKQRLFNDHMIVAAIERLSTLPAQQRAAVVGG